LGAPPPSLPVATGPADPNARLILASGSPRRIELLRDAGYAFVLEPANLDEERHPGKLLPRELALYLAQAKANAIGQKHRRDVTLAADTIVAFGDMPIGKPANEAAAREIIRLLSGTTHIVITAVALCCPDRGIDWVAAAMSAVRMRVLNGREVDDYVASGLWKGKAGGYGIQDDRPLITCVSGSTTNVIGLPMTLTRQLLGQAGIHVAGSSDAAPVP
jgi:septum formation protein